MLETATKKQGGGEDESGAFLGVLRQMQMQIQMHVAHRPRGRQKQISVTPVVGGWVRGQKRTRVRFSSSIFFVVFLNSPHREMPKNVIKNKSRKNRFWIFGRFFWKNFSTRFVLQNVFPRVFELPSLRNTRNRDKTKQIEEKLTSQFLWIFWDLLSTMDFLQTYFGGVFELPLALGEKRPKTY
jgi:hypothetical protein